MMDCVVSCIFIECNNNIIGLENYFCSDLGYYAMYLTYLPNLQLCIQYFSIWLLLPGVLMFPRNSQNS